MNVQDVLNDFAGKVAGLKNAEVVVSTRKVELNDAQNRLGTAAAVQLNAKVAAKVSFDAVLAEVAKLGLDSVVVPSVEDDVEDDVEVAVG